MQTRGSTEAGREPQRLGRSRGWGSGPSQKRLHFPWVGTGATLGGPAGLGALGCESRRPSPVVAAQREGALRGGGRAALEVVDAPLVDDDKAQGPCGRRSEGRGELYSRTPQRPWATRGQSFCLGTPLQGRHGAKLAAAPPKESTKGPKREKFMSMLGSPRHHPQGKDGFGGLCRATMGPQG